MKYVPVQARKQLKMVSDVGRLLGDRSHWDTMDRIVYRGIREALINKLESELIQ